MRLPSPVQQDTIGGAVHLAANVSRASSVAGAHVTPIQSSVRLVSRPPPGSPPTRCASGRSPSCGSMYRGSVTSSSSLAQRITVSPTNGPRLVTVPRPRTMRATVGPSFPLSARCTTRTSRSYSDAVSSSVAAPMMGTTVDSGGVVSTALSTTAPTSTGKSLGPPTIDVHGLMRAPLVGGTPPTHAGMHPALSPPPTNTTQLPATISPVPIRRMRAEAWTSPGVSNGAAGEPPPLPLFSPVTATSSGIGGGGSLSTTCAPNSSIGFPLGSAPPPKSPPPGVSSTTSTSTLEAVVVAGAASPPAMYSAIPPATPRVTQDAQQPGPAPRSQALSPQQQQVGQTSASLAHTDSGSGRLEDFRTDDNIINISLHSCIASAAPPPATPSISRRGAAPLAPAWSQQLRRRAAVSHSPMTLRSPASPTRPSPIVRIPSAVWPSSMQSSAIASNKRPSTPSPVCAVPVQGSPWASVRGRTPPRSPRDCTWQMASAGVVCSSPSIVRTASVATTARSRSGSPVATLRKTAGTGGADEYKAVPLARTVPQESLAAIAAAKVVPAWGTGVPPIRQAAHLVQPAFEASGMGVPPMLYDVDSSDPIDTAVLAEVVALHRDASTRLNVRRVHAGQYEIEGRHVRIFFGSNGHLYVSAADDDSAVGGRRRRIRSGDEGAATPLALYLRDVANVGPPANTACRSATAKKAASLQTRGASLLPVNTTPRRVLMSHSAVSAPGSPQPTVRPHSTLLAVPGSPVPMVARSTLAPALPARRPSLSPRQAQAMSPSIMNSPLMAPARR